MARELVRERALARAGRPGDARARRAPEVRLDVRQRLGEARVPVLGPRDQTGERRGELF